VLGATPMPHPDTSHRLQLRRRPHPAGVMSKSSAPYRSSDNTELQLYLEMNTVFEYVWSIMFFVFEFLFFVEMSDFYCTQTMLDVVKTEMF